MGGGERGEGGRERRGRREVGREDRPAEGGGWWVEERVEWQRQFSYRGVLDWFPSSAGKVSDLEVEQEAFDPVLNGSVQNISAHVGVLGGRGDDGTVGEGSTAIFFP